MLRKWPCREKLSITSCISHSPGNWHFHSVEMLTASNITIIRATSFQLVWGKNELVLAILVFVQCFSFMSCFSWEKKRSHDHVTSQHSADPWYWKLQRIHTTFPGCSGKSETWKYEKVLVSFIQYLTRVLSYVYNFLCFSSLPFSYA